ncbi:breast cancer type 2 susceptibility protein [Scomber scombrus]|uniref:breast cancer type 2 susceptibility protein n=1 Tax=Scomber scombrus TaxID=13677 RepID=UPI002DD9ED86|nr:breast cancer type 2 susceptibility protein [Scomber scombrus]
MDLPSESMYDTFKDDIWGELGPLDHDWFDVLTAQAVKSEGNFSDQDDLCAFKEGNFKTPFDETAVESQLFSTPKVFRHRRVVSPEAKDEQSFTAEPEKETLPWTRSPYIQISKEGVPGSKYEGVHPQAEESFDLLQTPHKSPVSYAKHISESLGAQIHSDISWTSSLNTPSAVPSTLILSKTDESPCPVNLFEDQSVVFVRKLFPSLSNASRVGTVSPKHSDLMPPMIQEGAESPEAGQNPEPHNSPSHSSHIQSDVWKQKLPDAIEDGEICSTVANVFDGAENVLSVFFSNSSSALRKVKTDRIKRKQIISAKEPGCSSTHISTKNTAASSGQRTPDRQPCRAPLSPHLKSPVKTGDIGTTQWSPLSLSEIPNSTVDISCHNNSPAAQVENNCLKKQLQSDSDCSQLVRPSLKISDSGFIKKKRQFVYTVKSSKPQVQEKEIHSQKIDPSPAQESNVKYLPNAQDKGDCCNIHNKTFDGKNEMQQLENVTEENLPPSVQAKVQDVEMSQLCIAFAQDFTEDTPQNGFSPSACLSALKQAKHKARQASLQHDCDGVRRHLSATNQNNSINEKTICDSGFQSAVADSTHMTAFSALPTSEKEGQTQQWTTPFQPTTKGNRKVHSEDILHGAETDASLSFVVKENQTLDLGRESKPQTKITLTLPPSSGKGAVDNVNCIPVIGQVHGSLPEKTIVSLPSVHASGFKTASNKGIRISSANLERAKRLFEESERERLSDQPTKCGHDTKDETHGSVKTKTFFSNHPLSSSETFRDINCQLTASQKADVTELCSLLEEADSQFEFTQLKIATPNQQCQDNATSPQKADKELDPDFLSGIDFDDSFSSDAEKPVPTTMMPGKMALVSDKTNPDTSKSAEMPFSGGMKKENFSSGNVPSFSKNIAEGSSFIMSSENLDRAEQDDKSMPNNKNPLTLGVGFKTAGGNVLRVSKKCLSKARALFADLEENLVTDNNPPDKQNCEKYSKAEHKDSVDNNFLPHKKDNSKLTSYRNDTMEKSCFSSMESVCSDIQVSDMRDDVSKGFEANKMDTAACQSGFQMVSGKGISISTKAMQKANALFKDCDDVDSSGSTLVKHKNSIETLPRSFSDEKNLSKCESLNGIKVNFSEEPVKRHTELENVNSEPSVHLTEVLQHNMEIDKSSFHGNQSSTAKTPSPLCTTPNNIGSSATDDLSVGGFCTASGKKVSVSVNAMTKAKCLLNEIQTHKDTGQQMKQKENSSRTGRFTNQPSGFKTAGGKGVVISSAALKKAKSLIDEYDGVEDEVSGNQNYSKIPVHDSPPRGSGFLAASGKPVAFSSEALQRAKALFDDISSSSEIPAVSVRKNDKKQENAQNKEKLHCGFSTAGGTIICVSQQHLLKAKNLLKEFDDDDSMSVKAMQETDASFKDCDVKESNDDMSVKQKSSESVKKKNIFPTFKNVPGVTVNVSEEPVSGYTKFENVKAGPDVHHEKMLHYDDVEIHKGVFKNTLALSDAPFLHANSYLMAKPLYLPPCTIAKKLGSSAVDELSNDGGFCTASGKKVSVSDDAMVKAKSLLNESATFEDTNRQLKQKEGTPQNVGFQTASGKGVAISSAALMRAKSLLSECDDDADKTSARPPHFKMPFPGPPPKNSGFLAASGKPVAFSSEALQRAKALFDDISSSSEIPVVSETRKNDNKQENTQNIEKLHCGFSTARGAIVRVSQLNLLKVKNLLKEFDDDSISVKAMQETDAFFKDCDVEDSLNTDIPAVSDTLKSEKKPEDAQNNEEKTHCGFTTAGRTKVQVSQKYLSKAKKLLREFDTDSVQVKDGLECPDSNSYSTVLIDTHNPGLSKDVKRTSNYILSTTCNKNILAEKSAPQIVKSHLSYRATDSENKILQNSSVRGCNFIKEKAVTDTFKFKEDKFVISGVLNPRGETRPDMMGYEIKQTSSSKKLEFKRTEGSSVLNFQSLNLSGCTEAQQKFLAQEALDCTKALLEDEGLAGQSLSMTFENMPQQDNPKSSNECVEEQKTTGKRLAKDTNMTGQPPPKRRLLDEFDRTVSSPRGSTLQPEKSCPTGVMKDRRVFKYSVSLHPNITRPNRDGKNDMVTSLQQATPHSSPGDRKSTHSKIPAFVPPFLKNSKMETHKNNMVKDNIRTPVFVPPFKKQRTIVQESSKPHEEEEKHHSVSVMPSNSNTFVPPTKKTSRQSTTDVTGNKSTEVTHTVALADNTKDDLVENRKSPVGYRTEDSAAEASGVADTLSRSQEIQTLQNIELARDMQDMRIRKKKRQTIRPLPGSLFLTKTSGVSKIPLKDVVNGKPPTKYTQKQLYGYGVHQHVSEITSENAQSFRFSIQQFLKREAFIDEGGVQLADGGWLIPSKNGTAGKEEFYRALCDTPGVDPKLISEEWVYNHYRWIVWKQASMERSFPGTMGSLCLNPEQVLLQLKYRYDVEVDHSRRPALRKIMEKDDTAAKTMVLCVCGVISRGHYPTRQSHNDAKTPHSADAKAENPCAVVWLTDGWYTIKAPLDDPLTAMLHKGRLAVGGKLIIHGAQLVGSQDACSPLEAPESLMLKICANSSRPARWDTKLGFFRDPRPFLLPLSYLYSNGGPVGCVDIVILRSYPIQWMERKPDGGIVFRSVRAEEKEARRYNSQKQKAMEIVFAKIQVEFEKEEKGNNKPQRRRRTISRHDIASLQDGEELYEAVRDDPAYLEAHLSEQQLETLHTYRRSLIEKKQAELQDRYRRALENSEENEGTCPKRDVTPVWRLCIADSTNQSSSVYQLNMWRPSSDLQSFLKEGCRYKVYNLTTSDGKKRSGIETVQFTGNKKTQFQDIQASEEWLSTHFQPRVSANFVDLQNPEFQPLCGEVDLTGYVISITDGQGSSPAFYLVDGKLNFVRVRCFSSLAQSGVEDVVKPRELLALSNLQLRGQSTSPTPVVYAGDLTVFSTNPKETHLQESLCQLRNLVQGQKNFFLTAEEKLSHLIRSVGMSSISSPALQPRTPAVLQQTTTDKIQNTKTSPIRSLGSFTPVSRNPPLGNGSTEKDPKSLKRRRALDHLSRIPSPPPVLNLSSVASPCVNKTFNPPRRSGTPSTLKTVQTPAPKPVVLPVEDEWVNDEELAMIDTQALHVGT